MRALLVDRCGRDERNWPELGIAARDEMFEVAWRVNQGDLDAGLADYLRLGEQIASLIGRVGETLLGDVPDWSLLDFGSGYGRVTRFLARRLGSQRVWASDLLPDTGAFLERSLGVATFPSAEDPGVLAPSREAFDLVYAGSLFTHLPQGSFARWLERLLGLSVDRGGVLLFTVHDERLLPAEIGAHPSGLTFVAESESRSLSKDSYGSTWVSRSFLERSLEAHRAYAWRALPRAVGHYQDLVVVVGADRVEALRGLEHTAGRRPDIDGYVERCDLRGVGRCEISGWVAGTVRPKSVELWLAEELAVTTLELLPRVSQADLCEWRLQLQLGAPCAFAETTVLIKAVDENGGSEVLFVGSLERLLFVCAAENFRRHYQRTFELADIVLRMKASRFWRLRRGWFQVKNALGLTTESPDEPRLQERDLEVPELLSVRPQRRGR